MTAGHLAIRASLTWHYNLPVAPGKKPARTEEGEKLPKPRPVLSRKCPFKYRRIAPGDSSPAGGHVARAMPTGTPRRDDVPGLDRGGRRPLGARSAPAWVEVGYSIVPRKEAAPWHTSVGRRRSEDSGGGRFGPGRGATPAGAGC